MNLHSLGAIFTYELARNRNALLPNIASPVISTALYFLVFGAALGAQVTTNGGLSYGAFIVPGLILLTVLSVNLLGDGLSDAFDPRQWSR